MTNQLLTTNISGEKYQYVIVATALCLETSSWA